MQKKTHKKEMVCKSVKMAKGMKPEPAKKEAHPKKDHKKK